MNTKQINVNEFKQNFCDTLQQEKQGSYFKIYVNDYNDLAQLRYYLNKSIHFITQAIPFNDDKKEFEDIGLSIEYLTEIIETINLQSECEGIDKLLI